MGGIEDTIEEFVDLEGVQREGLFNSQRTPATGEHDYLVTPRSESQGRKASRRTRAGA
jgi:hypothetical protein